MWLPQQPLALLLPVAVAVVVVQAASLNYVGCFSDPVGLVDIGANMFQSRGLCSNRCFQIDQWVVGLTNGTHCLCGSRVPPTHYLVADGHCNTPCNGYARDSCGGRGYFSVLVRDIELLQQQQRAADSGGMSEKLPGNLQQAGSF
ncbi:hypothetical protein PG985_014473 [Apiospora marii]|uniref:uncharacterized protein n=1 Tax=Apiospora marii TaxID=335849 RepID=UPI003131F595